MAKQIIWSLNAQTDRKEILLYWIERNKSTRYSYKLNQLFKEVIELLSEHPFVGRPTDKSPSVRIKIVKEYLLIFLTVWDGHQNPAKLEEVLK